jgi:hypothetical protein
MPETDKIYANGINAVTGKYLVSPMTAKQLMRYITGESDANILDWLQRMLHLIITPFMGFDRDPTDITQSGWGVVFNEKEDTRVKKAFEPLVTHRRKKVGNDALVKVMEYRTGEGLKEFLGRYGLAPGSKDVEKVPYYLLLAGSPEKIPFTFGQLLDIEYAVGRLDFDQPEEYSAYIQALIAYESGPDVPNAKQVTFFGTRHPFDRATILSADQLVVPLANGRPAEGGAQPKPGIAAQLGFQSSLFLGPAATKEQLRAILAPEPGSKPPALIFTASHGIGFPSGNADQLEKQGALLCQNWPGFGKINPNHYFAASDLPVNAQLNGMVTFHFACFGAGTPANDRFLHRPGIKPPVIAPKPFTAALPKALLARGALAVIGHIDRAWGYSFSTAEAGQQIYTFEKTVGRLLSGTPVGYAVKDFNERYATLSTNLNTLLETRSFGGKISDEELSQNWIERNDAEGYIVLGDPAVQLRVAELSV